MAAATATKDEGVDDPIVKQLKEMNDGLELKHKQLEERLKKSEESLSAIAAGTFNIRTEAGKLDPEDQECVRKNFKIERLICAAYWDQVEGRHDNCWERAPGKNQATFERDVVAIAKANRAAARQDLPGDVARAILQQAGGVTGLDMDPLKRGIPVGGMRAQTTGVGSEGGFLVPNQLGWYDDVLRNALVIIAAGVRNYPATGIPFYFNKKSTASTGAYLASETATMGTGSIVFSQGTAFPRVFGYYIPISRRALKLAQPDIAMIARDDLAQAGAQNRQTQLLKGTGAAGAPVGVINTAGVTTASQAATSLLTVAALISTVDKANGIIDPDTAAFIVSPGFKAKVASLMPFVAASVAAAPGAQQGWTRGTIPVWGFPMFSTAAFVSGATTSEGAFGCWSQASMIDWGQEIIFSEHALWTSQQVVVGLLDEHEIVVRRTESFSKFADGVTL